MFKLFTLLILITSCSHSKKGLCDQRGSKVLATYNYSGETIQKLTAVPGDNCMGSCGRHCKPLSLKGRIRYTQECLDHDLCVRDNPANFRSLIQCNDELISALSTMWNYKPCE